ncbi:MAG: hypothetical protein HY292_02715 [Planctomycetes bacterium]|nr:hypothetical protein [Planctomycetota bacterium]
MKIWKVRYKPRLPFIAKATATGYPSLGLALNFEGNKVTEFEHVISLDDTCSDRDAFIASHDQLRVFLDWLVFQQGIAVQFTVVQCEEIHQPQGLSRVSTGMVSISAGHSVQCSVDLPSETALQRALADPALAIWVQFARKARLEESDEDAIRDYFKVWEGIHGKVQSAPAPSGPSPEHRLKYARDFVSHSDINNLLGRTFVTSELQLPNVPATLRFDPSNPAHQAFAHRMRSEGRILIDRELRKHL